jgi:hypothetical protein
MDGPFRIVTRIRAADTLPFLVEIGRPQASTPISAELT